MPRPNKDTKAGQGSPMRTRTQVKWMDGGDRGAGGKNEGPGEQRVCELRSLADHRGAQTHLGLSSDWCFGSSTSIRGGSLPSVSSSLPFHGIGHMFPHSVHFLGVGGCYHQCGLTIGTSFKIWIFVFHIIALKNRFQRQQRDVS